MRVCIKCIKNSERIYAKISVGNEIKAGVWAYPFKCQRCKRELSSGEEIFFLDDDLLSKCRTCGHTNWEHTRLVNDEEIARKPKSIELGVCVLGDCPCMKFEEVDFKPKTEWKNLPKHNADWKFQEKHYASKWKNEPRHNAE